jgi:GT2 family glycosyltransferase/tetratricopeptide (TPR) repeat protein
MVWRAILSKMIAGRSASYRRASKSVDHVASSNPDPSDSVECPSKNLAQTLAAADRARDRGAFADAADHYATAVSLAPARTDIKIQLANMLKDSGRLGEAETVYAQAQAEDPDAADTHLQLGHLHKLNGRRAAALASYRRALALDPLLAAARLELAAHGESGERLAAYEEKLRYGGVDALLGLRAKLDEIAGQIALIRETLPDAEASVAFPLEAYGEMRRLFDCPPPETVAPRISVAIVLLADREPLARLHAQLAAIADQSHQRWRLTVLGVDADRRDIVARAAASDTRIDWLDQAAEGLAEAELRVAVATTADWTLFLARGARLHRHTLAWIAAAASRTVATAMVFDEEVDAEGPGTGGRRPILRQAVDADSLRDGNLYGETIAVSSDVLADLDPPKPGVSIAEARIRLLRALVGVRSVAHLPLPLVATPMAPALEEQRGILAPPRRALANAAGLAVIIPTRDNVDDAAGFVESLISLALAPDTLEILVLNNGRETGRDPVLSALARRPGVTVSDIAEPFNWSRFNNLGAAATRSENLVFANDDMRMLTPGWDQIVLGFLERPDVGAVGARLLYDDNTLQHGGILFDWRGSVIHDGLYRPADEAGPTRRWHVTRSASAVTGAFLATRRADFDVVAGFDETGLAVSYGDIDYALKQRARGLRIIWTPAVTLYHHESKTRGLDHLSVAKSARDAAERKVIERRWPGVLGHEPSLNPFWHQATLPHRLLSFPSQVRLWRHIEASARINPWMVEAPRSGVRLDSDDAARPSKREG